MLRAIRQISTDLTSSNLASTEHNTFVYQYTLSTYTINHYIFVELRSIVAAQYFDKNSYTPTVLFRRLSSRYKIHLKTTDDNAYSPCCYVDRSRNVTRDTKFHCTCL